MLTKYLQIREYKIFALHFFLFLSVFNTSQALHMETNTKKNFFLHVINVRFMFKRLARDKRKAVYDCLKSNYNSKINKQTLFYIIWTTRTTGSTKYNNFIHLTVIDIDLYMK